MEEASVGKSTNGNVASLCDVLMKEVNVLGPSVRIRNKLGSLSKRFLKLWMCIKR